MLEIENQKQSLGESNSVNVANAQVGLTKAMFEHMASITAQQNIEKKFYNFFSILPSNIELPTISNDFASNEAELVNLGLNNSFVLNSYKNQILEQQLKVKFQRAAVLPKINARFSIRSPLPLLKPQEYLTTADFVVAITIPIFNYNTAFLEARSETRALNMLISQYKDILEEIKVSIVSELKQYNSIKQQVEYSKDYVKFISIALTATQHEYELGNIRITDLLKVQNSFYDAQIEDIKVNVELLKHMYKIKQLTNQLTAKALNLQVDYFIPEQKIKFKN
ncbi:outer membrane efflux family protein [Orientia chuto str. Dubai]|uniref:Outer membrane efflux family protein n=2 Tax=Candidatus Orientia mediorientalis TaxID=911112 RepID=A0A0F3MND1_9RICK|nr:outer membrane efflux family protein [Orientia chuto str. Dubai]